jgi:hypothetical protein
MMVIGWPINFLLFRCEDVRRRMLHELDQAASVLVEELTILGPQWHPLRSQQSSRRVTLLQPYLYMNVLAQRFPECNHQTFIKNTLLLLFLLLAVVVVILNSVLLF